LSYARLFNCEPQ